jgi:hypothetical protein
MSAKGRGSVVAESEFYPTPPWVVHRILGRLALPSGEWLEPSAGDGAIVRAVNRSGVRWTLCELRPQCQPVLEPLGRVEIGDFLALDLPDLHPLPGQLAIGGAP